MRTVAALYVDPKGPYPKLPGVECWDVARDARLYRGPHPVVAHPPCQLWGPFAAVNFKRWGGEHNRPGNDGGSFAAALAAVRQYGGVLEHPAGTRAWAEYDLIRPPALGWGHVFNGEWVCEVWQSAYGHKARKRTWLFYKGRFGTGPAELDWTRQPGTHQCGYHDQRGPARNKPTVGKHEASATPLLFAEALLALARGAK